MTSTFKLLNAATHSLQTAGITTARLDALVLLEDATGRDRSWLLAHPEQELTLAQLALLDGWLARRGQHEPLAYIRGHAEFYGRQYQVTPDVLVPRPETEAMIELLMTLTLSDSSVIADIGTGSGALAVSAALALPRAQVIATDISSTALMVAKKNAQAHNASVKFYEGDLLAALHAAGTAPNILLCNLPYVPDNYPINRAAGFEPRLALFSGADGLDHYRRLFEQIDRATAAAPPAYVLTEALSEQHSQLHTLAVLSGYQLNQTLGLVQVFGGA